MNRRDFVVAGLAVGAAAVGTRSAWGQGSSRGKFRMKYAPHFGMFRNSAGNDPIDQLKFAADQGFTAWEDNGMMSKDVDLCQPDKLRHFVEIAEALLSRLTSLPKSP